MPDALDLLTTRRSVKPVELAGPAPSAAELETILTVASRVPDHGKLVPWRFIVFSGEARARASQLLGDIFAKKNPQATPDQIAFERNRFNNAPLVVAMPTRLPFGLGSMMSARRTLRNSSSSSARARPPGG